MRTEKEMFELILHTAEADDRIRAVYMNGSRANPNVDKDKYRDYDIVYAVTETESFIADRSWISVFGETAIVQEPDANDLGWGMEHDFTSSYAWLMLFTDGSRIDLTIIAVKCAVENYLSDTLCIKLLDKDNLLPEIPEANDSMYYTKAPSKSQYDGCCNEFWWCLNNVAKGIVRRQMPYVQIMYTQIVHTELDKMMEWYIAKDHDFKITTGKWGKYFEKYLSSELYVRYESTYSDCNVSHMWDAVFNACSLFHDIAGQVAAYFGYNYNLKDEEGMRRYLASMQQET